MTIVIQTSGFIKLQRKLDLEKDLTEIFDASSSVVILLDSTGTILFSNLAIEELFGYEKAEITGNNIAVLVPPKYRAKHADFVRKVNAQGSSRDMGQGQSFPGVHKSGHVVYVSIGLRPLMLRGEQLTVATITKSDVLNETVSSLAQSQLKENNEVLETTAKIAKLGFYSVDMRNNKLSWSQEVFNIHDLPVDHDISIEEAFSYYAPSARPRIQKAVEQCMLSGDPFDLELPFTTAKKRDIWVRALGYPEYENGEPIKLKGAFQDITHMRQAAIEANQAMRTKSAFLANMSHELRTPINGILGISELLADTPMSDKQNRYIKLISQSANSLLYLVNQVLDYSKLGANKQTLRKQVFSLRATIEAALSIHQLEAQRKHLDFSIEIAKDVPELMVNDVEVLKQVINNLCSNALKFTDTGSIKVEIYLSDEQFVRFKISDTGIGIEAKDLERLFVEFNQLDNSFSRAHGGSGLGLTIAKQLVELMGGKVGVESTFGVGTSFFFTLPIVTSVSLTTENTRFSGATHSHEQGEFVPDIILLVENENQAQVFDDLAKMLGVKIKAVLALPALITSIKSEDNWRVIGLFTLPDSMPLRTVLRSVARVKNNLQHICLSESLLHSSKEKTGIEDFQVDIIEASETGEYQHQRAIEMMINNYQHFLARANYRLEGKRILLAEDNEINQLVSSQMLLDLGADVSVAQNGEDVLAMLESGKCFDVILMDCQMPRVDGYQAAQRIKANASDSVRNHTIIAATAHGLQEDIERCYQVGMKDVLVKPFTRQQLLDVLIRNL
ncbi:ATP-binding protein [Ningiella sp. W23]|uniref:ATP-binding protein n=1 Tax=Ningiella sp. W23 TaxID=3023715 RepID=UPI0037572E83